MKNFKRASEYIQIALLASLSALNYNIFVFPNKFAPAGLDGICTMIQDVMHINMGYLSLLLNIPLLIAVYRHLSRDFAVKSTIYILSFSSAAILLNYVDLSAFVYHTSTSIIFAPIAAGVVRGILYAFTLRVDATSGGMDLVAALIKKRNPHLELMNVIFMLNMMVALMGYFVYGHQYEPVICSIIYSFLTSAVTNRITANSNKKVRYEVITPDYQDVCHQILDRYDTTSTIVDAKGAFAGTDNKIVICVAEKKKAPYIEELLNSFANTVIFKSEVVNRMVGVSYK